MRNSKWLLPVLAAMLTTSPVVADDGLRQPVPTVHALVGVRVVTEPGKVVDGATLVVRDGLIEAVGTDLPVPADAHVIEFEGADPERPVTVYPGLIDAYLPLAGKAQEDETPVPEGVHPLVRPDRRLSAEDWPADQLEAMREAGFTTALIVPSSGLFRGQSVVANLGEGGFGSNLLKEDFAQHAHLAERAPKGAYPQSLMGAVALYRQTLSDAVWQQRALAAWARNPAQPRPQRLPVVAALEPVLEGRQPLVFETDDVLDSLRVLTLTDPDIALVLVGNGEEYKRLSSFPRKVPIVLPLAFPKAPGADDENDRDVSLEELRHWKHAPENPQRLSEAGFALMFTAARQSAPKDLLPAVARAIEHGFSARQALAALTTEPARWLGIDAYAGRIAPGYMANLVIADGELFADKPTLREVWVDGRRFELARMDPPEVDAAGTWALSLAFGGMGEIDGTLVLQGAPTAMTGTIEVMGSEVPVAEARVSGKTLTVKIDASRWGQGGTTTIRLEIDGDRGRGTGSGPFGEFSVRGQRTSGPGTVEVL